MTNNKNLVSDPVGIGIRYPVEFKNGGLRLTAETIAFVSNQEGVGEPRVNGVDMLVSSKQEKRDTVRQAMRRIAKTRRGSRFMEGQKGTLVDRVLFEVNDEVSQQVAVFYMESGLREQEKRVQVLNSSARSSPVEGEEHIIEVFSTYQIRDTDVVSTDVIFERSTNG